MRTSQQAQLQYLCSRSSSVMNELIDFTLSFFSIDPAGPAAQEELCSRSCFPLSPALFRADETAPGLSEGGNPHTSALVVARWVIAVLGWREEGSHLPAVPRASVNGWKVALGRPMSSWGICPALHRCLRSSCGHRGGLQVAPILPSLLNLNYLWESSAGLTAKRLPPSGVSANLCDQQGKPRNHTDGADVCV